MASVDDAMDRYARGEASAFAEVYDHLAPRLLGYLRRLARSEARAEDLLQQTFLQMHRARGQFIQGAAVTPWAYAIARRLFLDDVRKHRRDPNRDLPEEADAIDPGPTAEENTSALELSRAAERELSQLPEPQRAAFVLVRIEGLPLREAAAILGTTEGAIKLRLHRAGESLRHVLAEVSR